MHADHFIDQLRILAALDDSPATDRTLAAFRAVAREDFAGPGPWKLRSGMAALSLPPQVTPDADPKWLYHSVLVVLDEGKGINIGDPSLWVRLLARADVQLGARILQVGAGVGYYTAILSALAGPTGRVIAYEVEGALAARAAENLTAYDTVEIRHGNAATDLTGNDMFDLIVAFAGVTHVPDMWATRLAPGARLLLPLTGDNGWGAMILAHQTEDGFEAVTLGPCGFYPCAGARRDNLATDISALFSEHQHIRDWRLRIIGTGDAARIEAAEPARR